ncbi:cobalamin biosynthesis protein CobW [Rhodococcus spongiicola]|uniref:Cobalamin biosynthesis protein CobW n=1 Tax=Rhodococcus spongiicola TaxID=2487352 RepID=A0A3S3ZR26_9NOCA|nr:GTP-binding protein [Rhodococcus spongiicola]RVW06327.1 cobalamin biosynthesis protein CobW [Rhodococcus spongiicola]
MTIVFERCSLVAADPKSRTPLIVVSGRSGPVEATARSFLGDREASTVVVRHDLGDLGQGIVRRTLTTGSVDAQETTTEVLELAHGCVSCTLRHDLLPLLRRLHSRSSVDRIVLELDSALEPEAVCWAVEHVPVVDVVGQIDGPAGRDVRIEAVVTCLDVEPWWEEVTGDEDLDDDRTVAQVAVGQVAFADALVVDSHTADPWLADKVSAVLTRLAPGAPTSAVPDGPDLLSRVGVDARRGRVDGAHSPLLRGHPPLDADHGVALVEFTARRPFHPGRLHEAIDVLLDGVVAARGRFWLATRPDIALWLESAGEGLRVAAADRWLADMTDDELLDVDPERRALASVGWDERFGDRDTSLVILVHDAEPEAISAALGWALLTERELVDQLSWSTWDDPFGEFHTDPCADIPPGALENKEAEMTREVEKNGEIAS